MDSEVALLIHHLSRAHHLMQGLLMREISRNGIEKEINPGMRPIFCMLAGDVGLSISELAQRLDQAKSSVTGAVRRMEKAGLVALVSDGDDGRRKQVRLTARGRDLVPVCERIEATIEEQLGVHLEPGDIQDLLRLLIKLTDLPEGDLGPF